MLNSIEPHINGKSDTKNGASLEQPIVEDSLPEAVIASEASDQPSTTTVLETVADEPASNPPLGDELETVPVEFEEPIVEEAAPKIDLNRPKLFINRELSAIEFNRRVLEESQNSTHPLLERAKFIAIFASNMDELFMVRVSGLKQQVMLGITDTSADGMLPRKQLSAIHKTVTELIKTEMSYWDGIQKSLADEGIVVRDYKDVKSRRRKKLRQYFEDEIFPILTPLAFDPSHPFPHISNMSLNLAVVIRDPVTHATRFARVKVPNSLPRLVPFRRVDPDEMLLPTSQKFVWLEQIIRANLDRLFPGMEIIEAHPFRVTRNNDMEIQEEEADDLLLSIEANLRQRHFGSVVRLEVEKSMPKHMLDMLIRNLDVTAFDVYTIDGPLALSNLWELLKIERPDLKDDPIRPKHPAPLRTGEDIFSTLRKQDVMIHRPYDSFSDVVDFLDVAAVDPDVLAIKMTLYRVGPNPAVVHALMKARENGKQVAVLVELKARFDEESNIGWARALENAGVHVVYGLIGLKIHAKMALVIRRERSGIRRYLHLSTGNYNLSTSRIYTDLDLLTSDKALGADATEVFNYLTGFSNQQAFRKFLVAPITLRSSIMENIEREMMYGEDGYIILNLNSLVDAKIIQALYRASQAGVKIDLIVRGICCLRPGVEGISENITVRSIIGRFLEHPRIFYFQNGKDPVIYIGSADLMPRNLDRRVEVVFPIENDILKAEILDNILLPKLKDNKQSYIMDTEGNYLKSPELKSSSGGNFSSQEWFLNTRETYQQPVLAGSEN